MKVELRTLDCNSYKYASGTNEEECADDFDSLKEC